MCDPKTRLQGSLRATKCLDASYSVPRHHTITIGTHSGSPGHPRSGKIQLVKFSPFSSQICLTKMPKPQQDHLVPPQNPSAGVPAGHQVLGCLLQCPKTPHNQYGALPWGPPGTLGPAKSKTPRISPIPGSPKRTRVKNPKNPQKVKKNRNSAKMRPFHQKKLLTTIWPIYSG